MIATKTQPYVAIANTDLHHCEELLESIDDALIATDKNFVITNWNKAAERIYGITAEDAVGVHRTDLLQYEYSNSSLFEILNDLNTIGKWKGILKFIKEDESEIYLQSTASVLKNYYGETTGYVAVNRDITKQYMAEQSLQNFTSILNFLDESFLIIDTNLKVVFESQKNNTRSLYKSDYKTGDHILKYVPDDLKDKAYRKYLRVLSGETISSDIESEGNDMATKVYLHITYMPVKNAYGIVSHAAVIIKDLTEEKRFAFAEIKRKEAEERLYQSRLLFEEFMENCPLPAWITTEDGSIIYQNSKYATEFNLALSATENSAPEQFPKRLTDNYNEISAAVLKSNTVIDSLQPVLQADGSSSTYLITIFPLQYQGKRMAAGWGIDISEQIKTQELLEETNAYKDKILSVIAHDLRSPLTVISSLAQIVTGDDTDVWSNEELLGFFKDIKTGTGKALNLLKELLLWGQSQMNKVTYKPHHTDVAAAIYTSVDFLEEKLREKNIIIEYNLQPDTVAYADVDMLKTVIRNFVSNAVKFSPVEAVIKISAETKENKIYISVADEGMGVKEELKKSILKGTNATSSYGTKGEKGIGMGLGICKDFIEANKGVMTISSNEIKGTIFTFSVPEYIQSLHDSKDEILLRNN